MDAKSSILHLLAQGHKLALAAGIEDNIRTEESFARRAVAYFQAANVLLGGLGELYQELIEHPDFVDARKFCRKYNF